MSALPCRVFILAGGLGTRLRGLFPDQPKAMVPIAGRPFLWHQVALLAGQGFRDFVFCVGFRAEQIVVYFGDGAAWNLRIAYSREPLPLGTAGALRQAASFFTGSALVLNGDTYLDTDFRDLLAQHGERSAPAALGTLGLVQVADCSRYGEVLLAPDRRLRQFAEKTSAPPHAGLVNAGAYVFEPAILEAIAPGRAVSLEHETFPALLSAGAALYGAPLDGTFVDIGTPEGYAALEQQLSRPAGGPR